MHQKLQINCPLFYPLHLCIPQNSEYSPFVWLLSIFKCYLTGDDVNTWADRDCCWVTDVIYKRVQSFQVSGNGWGTYSTSFECAFWQVSGTGVRNRSVKYLCNNKILRENILKCKCQTKQNKKKQLILKCGRPIQSHLPLVTGFW